jgi:hypothetical protein
MAASRTKFMVMLRARAFNKKRMMRRRRMTRIAMRGKAMI